MVSAKNPALKYILITWLVIICPVLLFFLVVLLTSVGTFGELPEVEELQNPKNNLASIVYSSDGNVLGKFYKENRVNVNIMSLAQI
jgi:penicillin-binding protein 1A